MICSNNFFTTFFSKIEHYAHKCLKKYVFFKTFLRFSIVAASLNKTPLVAPSPDETIIDIGVASPNAQGQAIIKTETELIKPNTQLGSGPKKPQIKKAKNDYLD